MNKEAMEELLGGIFVESSSIDPNWAIVQSKAREALALLKKPCAKQPPESRPEAEKGAPVPEVPFDQLTPEEQVVATQRDVEAQARRERAIPIAPSKVPEALPGPKCETCEDNGCTCQSCGKEYGIDLIVPDDWWEKIKPQHKPKGAGLLCPICIIQKLESYNSVTCLYLSINFTEQPKAGEFTKGLRQNFPKHLRDLIDCQASELINAKADKVQAENDACVLRGEIEQASKAISDLAYENARIIREYEERDASVCPEDVGPVEYIKQLQAQLAVANEEIEQLKATVRHTVDYCKVRVGMGLMAVSAAVAITGLPYIKVSDWPEIDTSDGKTFNEQIAKAERIVKEQK